MPDKPILTRDALLNGDIERLVHDRLSDMDRMCSEERGILVNHTLRMLGDTDLWIFGYGSLIWNPALNYEEQRRCSIEGYKKKFCFWTTLSRGSIDNPGLMMGLMEGEGCNGVAFRISAENARSELDVLYRREMSHYIYKPTWVDAQCVETDSLFKILTFVVDKENHRFVNNLSIEETVRTIATAEGPLGRNCDYLYQLSQMMQELGFDEPELDNLALKVKEFQRSSG